jgi:hypothetical protein
MEVTLDGNADDLSSFLKSTGATEITIVDNH